MFNLSTNEEIAISTDGVYPDIYNNKIVWVDRYGRGNVYMYDVTTSKITQITTGESASNLAIYGDKIVWADSRNDNGSMDQFDIYMYDLSPAAATKPVAAFTANVTSGAASLVVLFTDTSTVGVPTSWLWDFGNGINSKHAMNATHTFVNPGVYNVSLTVTNTAGSNTLKESNCITVTTPQAPTADFFFPQVDKGNGYAGFLTNETLSFIDNSTGSPTSWLWDFGDGATSTAQNPNHKYTREGGYTVTLTVKNAIGSNTVSKHGYALVRMDNGGSIFPANFSSNVTSGIAPLTVLFHDTTFPDVNGNYAYGRLWDFGDRTNYGDDYDENNSTYFYVTHTYKKPGKYTVTLTSFDIGGSSIITKYNYITAKDPKVPATDFSANVTSGAVPLVVLFTDTSNGGVPTSWLWDFGDGINSKRAMNSTHTFTNPGNYTISLTVENAEGDDSVVKPNYIVVTDPKALIANFSSNVTEDYAPLAILFTDLSQNAAARSWDFNNDGIADSSDLSHVYTYTAPGTYIATLTVSNTNKTISKTATITVLEKNSSSGEGSGSIERSSSENIGVGSNGSSSGNNNGSSSGGSGGSHSNGGGGASGSPEPAKNVEVKELSQAFIASGKNVHFNFTKNATCVIYVSFDAKKTLGKTTTIVEMLKGKSTLVSESPSGEVYKSFRNS